jgi:hypothetical protein
VAHRSRITAVGIEVGCEVKHRVVVAALGGVQQQPLGIQVCTTVM